jgi:hypothetical protein
MPIFSTPRCPEDHAKRIRKRVESCTHGRGGRNGSKHGFTLILDGVPDLTPEVTDRLFEAGCDDALISRCDGQVSMDFDRVAPTLREAITSAIQDTQRAGIGARVVRIEEVVLDPGGTENAARDVGAINGVLQLSAAIERLPRSTTNRIPATLEDAELPTTFEAE